MTSAAKTLNTLLGTLTPRQKDVVSGRFGLDKSGKAEPETLAAIGDRFGVTRERVRQIENSALVTLAKQVAKDPVCIQILSRGKKFLQTNGGVAKKEDMLNNYAGLVVGLTENHLALLLEASGTFNFYPEDNDFHSFYYLNKESLKLAANFINDWAASLQDKKDVVLAGAYNKNLADFVKSKHVTKVCADSFLGVSKNIGTNAYGDVGLKEWSEINPMATRDRIYLVLKKLGKPLHFTSIADAINTAGLTLQKALAATVHNELIKDQRFVLVGRGMYGLKEHGYEPGVAREVIERVLKTQGPLRAEEVVELINRV